MKVEDLHNGAGETTLGHLGCTFHKQHKRLCFHSSLYCRPGLLREISVRSEPARDECRRGGSVEEFHLKPKVIE